jgi:hypothetical protein
MDCHPTNCSIEQVGKQRNGKPRYWCSVHRAGATGRFGARLAICEGAYLHAAQRPALEIDPANYPGGIAIWGAVPPVFDTTNMPAESGIHVHARGSLDDSKEIDDTFDAVVILHRRDLLEAQRTRITSEVAVNFYLSRFAQRDIRLLRCPRCGEVHLDSGYFAVKPHRRHLCHGCGNYFNDTGKAVSNPMAMLSAQVALHAPSRRPVRAPQTLDIKQAEYPGGVQVWASNPALVWTADRPEQEGLHVHAFAAPDKIVVDETFDQVRIDGVLLDEKHVQYLMAQSSLPHLANKIVSLKCTECGHPHFDQGDQAFFPHIEHECEACGSHFVSRSRRRMVVSNPFIRVRDALYGREAD